MYSVGEGRPTWIVVGGTSIIYIQYMPCCLLANRSCVSYEFQAEFKWLRIRSSKNGQAGEPSQPSYEQRRGTVVEFLDDFEASAMRKFPHHRFTIMRQKDMAAQFERNRGPGWVQSDVDFAMDGTIPPPGGVSVQSDHWSPMSFTLFESLFRWCRGSRRMHGSNAEATFPFTLQSLWSRRARRCQVRLSLQRDRIGRRSSCCPLLRTLLLRPIRSN